MSTSRILMFWLVLIVVTPMPAAGADPERITADKEAVRKVLEAQVTAWNRGDLDGFMAGYWRSEDLTFFSGADRIRGWQKTVERYRKRYQAEGKTMGQLAFSELEVDVTGPDCAWARGRWKVAQEKDTVGGLFTLILKKFPEGWRIVHDHTSGP